MRLRLQIIILMMLANVRIGWAEERDRFLLAGFSLGSSPEQVVKLARSKNLIANPTRVAQVFCPINIKSVLISRDVLEIKNALGQPLVICYLDASSKKVVMLAGEHNVRAKLEFGNLSIHPGDVISKQWQALSKAQESDLYVLKPVQKEVVVLKCIQCTVTDIYVLNRVYVK